jgi:hypothetical protein
MTMYVCIMYDSIERIDDDVYHVPYQYKDDDQSHIWQTRWSSEPVGRKKKSDIIPYRHRRDFCDQGGHIGPKAGLGIINYLHKSSH